MIKERFTINRFGKISYFHIFLNIFLTFSKNMFVGSEENISSAAENAAQNH